MALIGVLAWISAGNEGPGATTPVLDSHREAERDRMVDEHVIPRGVKDPAVLAAMRRVPRHRFVPREYSAFAYMDGPLPIGHGQSISQPSLIARMTEVLSLKKTDKVLEVGTGSGYQAAILAELVDKVLTIEILEPLARQAERILGELGYRNVKVRVGDGYQGWPSVGLRPAVSLSATSSGAASLRRRDLWRATSATRA
jgi:protein-L-isoaspartate(D-aspartate) O-methyltransferase